MRLLVRVSAWAVFLIGAVIGVMLLTDSPPQVARAGINLGAAAVAIIALLLARANRWPLACQVLVWGVWVMVALVTAKNGGVGGPNLLNFPVLVVLAGWLLGPRSTVALTLASVLLLAFLQWAGWKGLLPALQPANPWAHSVYLTGILSLTGAATVLSRRSYLRRVREAQDIAAHLAASEAEQRKLLRAIEQSPESIVITDLQEHIEFVNDAFLRRSGYTLGEVLGQRSSQVSSNGMGMAQRRGMREVLAQGEIWAGEQVNQRKDGTEITESVVVAPIRKPDGHISHYVEYKQDITERKRAAEELHRLAHSDSLTGLPNRFALMERLASLPTMGGRAGPSMHALLLLDVDRFTSFNDARGSLMGDRLLCAVALRLSERLPAQALLVRVAADEFGIVLQGLGTDAAVAASHALSFAAGVHQDLHAPMGLESGAEDVQLSASIGITLYPQGVADSAHDALRRAGTALHRAKQAGGAQTAFFEQEMSEAAEQRFRIERELRHAIGAGELRLYLQSQVDSSGQLAGAEALVRWQHPREGLLSPFRFIPLAEESELIVALDDWMLQQACQLLTHPVFSERQLRLSVNLSARHFQSSGFAITLQQYLGRAGADPRLLTLEVTEGLIIQDFDDVVARMRELNALGVELSLDDFGTGYSSLAYLKRLPIQELKIDRSFVRDAPDDADDAALVEGILSVATHFGLRVVAEGVETQAQADFLAARAPAILHQGYLFSKPAPQEVWLSSQAVSPSHSPGAAPGGSPA